MTPKPLLAGFLQAAGLAAYVGILIHTIFLVGPYMKPLTEHESLLNPLVALLLFVFSALVCGTIALTYPLLLAFDGKRMDAVKAIVATIFFLGIIFAITLLSIFFLA